MQKQKMYTAINIGGLAIGIAACLLIALFIQNETGYDCALHLSSLFKNYLSNFFLNNTSINSPIVGLQTLHLITTNSTLSEIIFVELESSRFKRLILYFCNYKKAKKSRYSFCNGIFILNEKLTMRYLLILFLLHLLFQLQLLYALAHLQVEQEFLPELLRLLLLHQVFLLLFSF
jgi:hypothetical protein